LFLLQFADRLFKCLVMFLLDVEDDQQWHAAEDEKHEHEGGAGCCWLRAGVPRPCAEHLSMLNNNLFLAPFCLSSVGEGELFDFGQECLDRIALSLGANTVAAAAGALLPVRLAGGWQGYLVPQRASRGSRTGRQLAGRMGS